MARRPLLVALLLPLAAACAAAPTAGPRRDPADAGRVALSEPEELGSYLAVAVEGAAGRIRLFLPPSEPCRRIAAFEGPLRYEREGALGTLWAPPLRCEPVGIGDLVAWRDRLPQRRSRFLQPRERARFRLEHRAEGADLLLLRGRFPLALELRWPDPLDTVAITSGSAACRRIASSREALMEFRATGPDPLVLSAGSDRCAIVGLARPLTLD